MNAIATKTSAGAVRTKQPPVGKQQPSRRPPETASTANFLIQRAPNCACGGECPRCQSKSAIAGAVIQRKCSGCSPGAGCDECQEETIQRQALRDAAPKASAVLSNVGTPLPERTRAHFEPLLGHDLSAVRVHTGPEAASAARAVDAQAFTVGHRIAFDEGRFAPDTNEGRRLLGHELVHVVQQERAGPSFSSSSISSPDDPAEREADSAAEALLSGRTVSPRLAPSSGVHRKVLDNVQLEPTRPAAQACVVHLHGEEKTAKAVAKDLYDHRCVNYVHLDTKVRVIKYEVSVTGTTTKGATTTTYACTADPNRIFTLAGRQGVGKACVKKGTGVDQSKADIETAAQKEMEDFVNKEWGVGISKCRGGAGTADLAGPLPVLALHNNTGTDDTSKPIFEKKAYQKQFVPDDPKLGGDPNPSYTADPSHRSDILLVTKETDYAAIKPHFNVLFQNIQPGGDDGSLSVILEKERFINVEKRGLNNTALKSLGGGFSGHDAMYVKDYSMAAKALEVLGVPDGPCGATPATTPTIAPPVVKPPPAAPTTGAGTGSGSSAPVPDAGTGSGSSAPVPDAGSGSGGSTPTTGTPTTTPQPPASTGPYDYEPVTDKDKPSANCLIFDPSTIVASRDAWAKKLGMLPVSDVLNWILGAWNFEAGTPKVVPEIVMKGVEESRLQRSCLLAAMVKGVTAQKGSVPVTKISALVDSGQRSFADQASIWNEKWKFTRKAPFDKISSKAAGQSGGLLSAGGKWNTSSTTHKLMWGVLKASTTSKDPEVEQFIKVGAVPLTAGEREKEILQASSAPGLSRHHAATDFDIGDTTKKDQLDSALWQPGGKFADFGRWLYHNAATWGFMRPFETKGGYGKGYMAEEWHWSYWPIAQALLDFARQNRVELEAALHKQWGGTTAKTQFTFVWNAWRDFLNNVEETPRF